MLNALNERKKTTPVIVLSGVTDVASRVEALDRGAVDVVSKPFSLTELLARVRRNVGLTRTMPDDRCCSRWAASPRRRPRCATFRSVSASLTEREVSLLAHLMRRAGQVCHREELLHDVWQLDFDPGSNVVEVCVGRLRAKLGRTSRSRRCAASATASTRTPDAPPSDGPAVGCRRGAQLGRDDRPARQRDGALPRRVGRLRALLRPRAVEPAIHLGRAGSLHRGDGGDPRATVSRPACSTGRRPRRSRSCCCSWCS